MLLGCRALGLGLGFGIGLVLRLAGRLGVGHIGGIALLFLSFIRFVAGSAGLRLFRRRFLLAIGLAAVLLFGGLRCHLRLAVLALAGLGVRLRLGVGARFGVA